MMKKEKIIVCDIDEVIANFVSPLIDFLNEKYDAGLVYGNIRDWNIWKWGNLSEEDYNGGFRDFEFTKPYERLTCVNGAREGLETLSEFGEVFMVTYRRENLREQTLKWLSENQMKYDKIFFSDNKSKLNICNKLNPDLIIDDSANQARILSNYFYFLLYDKPWNQDANHENVIRVKNWDEILERVNRVWK